MSRCGKPGKPSVSFQEKILKIARTYGPSADLQQGPCHIADHVMQKTVAFNGQEQTEPALLQVAMEDAADRGSSDGARFGETGKIMFADKQTCGRNHLRKIDGERVMKIFPHQMRRQDPAEINLIAVYLRLGIPPCVKRQRYLPSGKNADVVGEQAVERTH